MRYWQVGSGEACITLPMVKRLHSPGRLAANDVISHFLRHKEVVELEARIAAVEERLEGSH